MNYEIKSPTINEHLATQADIQGCTKDELLEKLCRKCYDLGLIERMAITTNPEEWGRFKME